jgi:hypothetical protein
MVAAILLELVKFAVQAWFQYQREQGKTEAELMEIYRIIAEAYAALPPPETLKKV